MGVGRRKIGGEREYKFGGGAEGVGAEEKEREKRSSSPQKPRVCNPEVQTMNQWRKLEENGESTLCQSI